MFVAVTQITKKLHTISEAGMLEVYIYIQGGREVIVHQPIHYHNLI